LATVVCLAASVSGRRRLRMRRHCAAAHAGLRRVHANTHTRASVTTAPFAGSLRIRWAARTQACTRSSWLLARALSVQASSAPVTLACARTGGTRGAAFLWACRQSPKPQAGCRRCRAAARPAARTGEPKRGGGERTQSQAARASSSAATTPTTTPTAIFQRSAGFTPPPPPPLSVCGATTVPPDADGASYVCARARPRQQPAGALLLASGAAATLRARQSCTWS